MEVFMEDWNAAEKEVQNACFGELSARMKAYDPKNGWNATGRFFIDHGFVGNEIAMISGGEHVGWTVISHRNLDWTETYCDYLEDAIQDVLDGYNAMPQGGN